MVQQRSRSGWSCSLRGLRCCVAVWQPGCQVHDPGRRSNQVDRPSGRGVVTVSVSLDQSALAAIGGAPALAAQLQDADLAAAGWTVTGPGPGPGSTTVVVGQPPATPPRRRPAPWWPSWPGSGPAGSRPFRLSVDRSATASGGRDRRCTGEVDLTCGVDCFGDSGLTSALGFPTGRQPGLRWRRRPASSPDQVFTFSLDARLPGSLVSTNGTPRPDGTLQLDAPARAATASSPRSTRTWNTGRIVAVSVAGAAWSCVARPCWWVRRCVAGVAPRRRRSGAVGRRRRSCTVEAARRPGASPEAVAPPFVGFRAWPVCEPSTAAPSAALTAPRWAGRCPACGAWNSLVEELERPAPVRARTTLARRRTASGARGPDRYRRRRRGAACRPASPSSTGCSAAGSLPGSVTLLGGEPGIGKSTLLLQALAAMARRGGRGLLVSAEESPAQVRRRAERLDALVPGLWLVGRDVAAGHPGRHRGDPAGRGGGRLHPDRVGPRARIRARVGGAGAGLRPAAGGAGQGGRPDHDPGRPRDQGGHAGRSPAARAPRGHGAVVRGRSPSRPPAAPVGQAPFRADRGARAVRDDRRRSARAWPMPAGCSWSTGAPGTPGSVVFPSMEGQRPAAGRDPGPGRARPRCPAPAARRPASTPAAWPCCWRCSTGAPAWPSASTTSTSRSSAGCGSPIPAPTWPCAWRWRRPSPASRWATTWWCSARSGSAARSARWPIRPRRLAEAARLGFTPGPGAGSRSRTEAPLALRRVPHPGASPGRL